MVENTVVEDSVVEDLLDKDPEDEDTLVEGFRNTSFPFSPPFSLLVKNNGVKVPAERVIQKNSPFITPTRKIMNTPTNTSYRSPLPSVLLSEASHDTCYPGSLSNPWTVHVDLDKPERNLIFDVVYIKRIEHGGWASEGVDIRVEFGAKDRDYWSAWIEDLLDHIGTSLIVRGRSRSSAFDEVRKYHRNKRNTDLEAAHQKTVDEMKQNPARLSTYYRLLFTEDLPLDNVILSGDPIEVIKHCTGVKYNVGNNTKTAAMFLIWSIEKKGVGHKIESTTDENID